MSTVIEKQKKSPGPGSDFMARVVVLNDSHNTFEGVVEYFCRVLPGMNTEKAFKLATTIHNQGQACVWEGPREVAELYHMQLEAFGLTLAPLS